MPFQPCPASPLLQDAHNRYASDTTMLHLLSSLIHQGMQARTYVTRALACSQEEGISLELSCTDSYKEVSQQLAQALQPPLEDPLQLRFTQQNNYSQQPKPNPLRHPAQEDFLLPDMLTQFNQPSDTLFYEVLDLPLPELERLKTLKVRPGDRRSNCSLSQSFKVFKRDLTFSSFL